MYLLISLKICIKHGYTCLLCISNAWVCFKSHHKVNKDTMAPDKQTLVTHWYLADCNA